MIKTTVKAVLATALVLCVAARADEARQPVPDRIQFNRDIRPILAENCYACHGPDANKRKADLRLDTKDGLFAAIKDKHPVVPGNTDQSELFRRITADDPDERMPDPKSGKRLSDRQIALLKKWIEQGAPWQGHWAFTVPVRPLLPQVRDEAWTRNAIDRFILTRLEAEGLKPSPMADKATLIRRLTLDLTGLPPTPKEVDAFLADDSPDAYEKVVDRLLADPHFGERMALDWLDASRFADTHGYHIDPGRDMTRWRQWVIDAFNNDKPFDQFTIEQLAGDLLPNPALDQKIATGFQRNSMINFEGGAIPEEYLTAYLIDRVSTTSTVFLGLTLNCCQCHDHKYDPFTQKDFYQLYAFFNGIPENGLDGQNGNAVPLLKLPTKEQQKKLDELAASVKQIEEKLAAPMPEADTAQAEWEGAVLDPGRISWTILNPSRIESAGGATLTKLPDGSVLASGPNPPTDSYTITAKLDSSAVVTALRLEALPDDSLVAGGPGRSDNGNLVLTDLRVQTTGEGSQPKPMKFKAASADFSQDQFPIESAIRGKTKGGWAIYPEVGKPHAAVFEFAEPIEAHGEQTLSITLDFHSPFPQHQLGRFRIAVTSSRTPRGAKGIPGKIKDVLTIAPEKRSDEQKAELRNYFRASFVPELSNLSGELAKLERQQQKLDEQVPTAMVMEEMPKPRDTFILIRGQYDRHGEKVTPDTPAALPPMPTGAPHNRLGLARWIVSPQNPLTARVTVNRLWQQFFGIGLVKTAEDFGSQGELPSHPELLDWLAVQFRDGDEHTHEWDVKAMVRLIVTSATYRQSSVVTPELKARDPENRLLARGPRFRLPAEFIRDQALAVSGLLNPQIGGKSVSPYQPPGLWEELMSRSDGAKWTAQVYVQSHGPDLYRRSMYTFWKRTSPPPAMMVFDAPDRETCTVRRARTNTPLQALVLWNDPTFVEAARKMAERIMIEGGPTLQDRIAFAFRLATARSPSSREKEVLVKVFERELHKYQNDPSAAQKLLSVGESPRNEELDTARLAAWTVVSSTILNLDETVTKG